MVKGKTDFNKTMKKGMKKRLEAAGGMSIQKLESCCITLEEMNRLGKLIKVFNLKTFQNLHDLYLQIDVFGLADVFEAHRSLSLKHYRLDPARFPSSASLFWQAMLKKCGQEMKGFGLQKMSDIDMYRFFEKGKRGGLCLITQAGHRANNPDLVPNNDRLLQLLATATTPSLMQGYEEWCLENEYDKDEIESYRLYQCSVPTPNLIHGYEEWCLKNGYNKDEPTSYLLYFDANNLYGWSMSQPLPFRGFKWVEDLSGFVNSWLTTDWTGANGAYLEVDLEYPEELHNLHRDFPMAPEHYTVTRTMLSPWTQERFDNVGQQCHDTRKLVPHLNKHERYVVHARVLQFYVKHGLIVREVHRAVTFQQKCWLKGYIDMNTRLRSEPGISDQAKDFFKLANNVVYGKAGEDVTKHVNCYIVRDRDIFMKKTCKPHADSNMQINENFAIVGMKKRQAVLDKPIYVGTTTPDLSKLLMYRFHYETMVPHFGRDNITMLMTDTDSFIYKIECKELSTELKCIITELDTSDYPKDHILYTSHPDPTRNKKVIGKFKDECNGLVLCGWEASAVKAYSLIYGDGVEVKHLKGVAKSAVKFLLSYSDWEKQRNAEAPIRLNVTKISSKNHELNTKTSIVKTLYFNDTKRYWFPDGTSLPLGHKDCHLGHRGQIESVEVVI